MSATGEIRWALAVAVGLCLAGAARAEDPAIRSVADIPPVERYAPDFYNAIAADGAGVTAAWAAAPAVVPVGGDFVLTLTIGGVANPGELIRPDLRKLPVFAERFQVEDDPAGDARTADGARFAYRLRPRSAAVSAVPSLAYRYYRPGFPPGRQMLTTYADAIPLSVAAPAEPPAPPLPLLAPEGFFALVSDSGWHPRAGSAWELALVAVGVVPAAVAGWVALWRVTRPGANGQRAFAFRQALARIAAARRAEDPAEAIADAVREYLRQRFGLPPTARTPGEVAAGLAGRGWDDSRVGTAERFFRACDEARFAPAGERPGGLADEAGRLIHAWDRGSA